MESKDQIIRRWVLIALVYFVTAVSLGVFMSAAHDYRLKGVHVHLNMLGWASMSLTAFVYRLFPAAAASFGAKLHFWLYQGALPVMAFALGGLLLGHPEFMPVVATGSVVMLTAIVTFVVTVYRHALPRTAHARPEPAMWNAA